MSKKGILLQNQIGDLQIRVWFRVVKNLFVYHSLGTLLIDRYSTIIYTAKPEAFEGGNHDPLAYWFYFRGLTAQQSLWATSTKHLQKMDRIWMEGLQSCWKGRFRHIPLFLCPKNFAYVARIFLRYSCTISRGIRNCERSLRLNILSVPNKHVL